MDQLLEFLVNHWALTVAFVVLLLMLLGTFAWGHFQGVRKVSPTEAIRLVNHEDAVVIDVRGDGEFKQGHILDAVHVPLDSLPERMDKLKAGRDRPVIATCRTGQRSATACAKLRKAGFERAYALSGGLVAWENANLPLVKK